VPSGGTVAINLSAKNSKTILIIEDSGPGIREEDRERVMERFYRAENHQEPGCGIGLSIVDRVVQMHQGHIQLAHANSGQGLKIIIEL
jgi:signal transduction histidine kinase